MKRFHWRLQKLLDVKVQQEQVLRLDLIALTQQALKLRQQIILRRSAVRGWLMEMRKWSVEQRISQQDTVIRCVTATETQIKSLEEELQVQQAKRKEKTDELMQIRTSRQTFERLGEEARREHIRQELLREQKELDDGAQTAFARKMSQPTISKVG